MKHIFLLILFVTLNLPFTLNAQCKRESERVAQAFIHRYPDPDVIRWGSQSNHFTWQSGYIMFVMEKMWRLTNDSTYYNYIQRFVDQNVDAEGNVPNFIPDALDNFFPGYACLFMYEQTGEARYAKAAETIRRGFDDYPRMDEGMFWHSKRIHQVWVDGVLMGQMFLARYAKTMHHPEDFAEVVHQMQGIYKLCGKPNGLLVHGYHDGQASPEVWSEGLGWCAVLFSDVFDFLPANQSGRDSLMTNLKRMCQGLKDSQDQKTGMWCQVVDKPNEPGNWNETSGTGMYLYLLQNAILRGYIPASEFQSTVDKAYQGILTKTVTNVDGFVNLIDCSSIGLCRSYEEYIQKPHEISTFAAFGSFILGTGLYEHTLYNVCPSPIYVTDYTQGKIFRLEKGAITWSHDALLCNDLQLTPQGILFGTGTGVLELNAKGDTLFRYEADCHVFACQRLANGNTFVGECENGRLLEINPKGKIVHTVCILPKGTGRENFAFMRNARCLPDGHYLVAHYGLGKVTEYDHKGREVSTIATPGGPHSVIRHYFEKDGKSSYTTLIAIADADKNPRIIEVDESGKVIWEVNNNEVAGSPLRFMSGMCLDDAGHLFATNWQGHWKGELQPFVFLFDRSKHLLAQLPPIPGLQSASNIALYCR